MRSLKLLTAVIAVSITLVTSCKKDFKTESNVAPSVLQAESNASSIQLSAQLKEKMATLGKSLPAGYEKRLERSFTNLAKTHPEYQNMVRRALGLQATPCDDNTPINQWLGQQLADWNSEVILYAFATGMLDFPTYDALFFENSSADQYYGVNGTFSHATTKAFKDLKRFWNIQSDNIVLVAMHGSMLLDRERVIRIDMLLYDETRAEAEFWADLILWALDKFPQYRNGDHPIFTFNAFAQSSFDFPPVGTIPSKIVMGDGVMEAYAALGYKDVAPQAILAHEFGHHIQFQLKLFGSESSPEATRRTELMADAYAAYYLSHARGAAMQWKRVSQFLQVFFNIGDCLFDNDGHHGTPTQRMAAARWGYSIADNAQKQGHILTAQAFTKLFEAQLPELVKQ